MADTLFYTADSIFFLYIAIAGIYLFVFALAALFRRSEKYPATGNMHRLYFWFLREQKSVNKSIRKSYIPCSLTKICIRV